MHVHQELTLCSWADELAPAAFNWRLRLTLCLPLASSHSLVQRITTGKQISAIPVRCYAQENIVPTNRLANIYVPAKQGSLDNLIRPGSGIVALQDQPAPQGYVVFYYEGNIHSASNLCSYEERIKCAAGRMFDRYPTTAMIALPVTDLDSYVRVVGTIDDTYKVAFTDEPAALAYGNLI